MTSRTEFDSWYRADLSDPALHDNGDTAFADGPSRPRKVTDLSGILRWVHHTEAWLGAVFGTMLTLLTGTLVLLKANPGRGMLASLCLPFLMWLFAVVELPFLIRLWAATVKGQRPIGVAVARSSPVRNTLMQTLAAIWWLGHVVIAMLFVVVLEVRVIEMMHPRNGAAGDSLASVVVSTIVLGMTVCCNTYLALLVKAVFGNDDAVTAFWRWRLVVDVGVTVLALWIASSL